MSTAKAKYMGDGSGKRIPDFSDNLRQKLRAFYPDQNVEADPVWGHPADAFVEAVLSEAWWAKSALHAQEFESTKAEVRVEHADMLKSLLATERKLRNLSPDLDRLLGVDADPLGCADQIALMAKHVEAVSDLVEQMSKAKKPMDKQHAVAVELALRVLRVLQEQGIPAAATGDSFFGYTSNAIRILKLIGDDLRLVRDELTWRDIIIKAKQQAPDLQ
ncbi:hypothetical protein [Herbaspirillum sp. SJZ107]|uniref:hypothetical protein n=1 Tax=Herbaspirillum sp. SJZ107 TaxID=2572881 RepID=UPI00114F54F3|nr:hypothetical protein [Herbaspirillum sp. SJZ107]TQK04957.1 hypothetical protein FBX97_3920 [Herbaspirillum sp. SJZ107]